ncbi:MAG: PhoPQ-activated pathogenicity-related family protein [Acidobacteriota bacterium]
MKSAISILALLFVLPLAACGGEPIRTGKEHSSGNPATVRTELDLYVKSPDPNYSYQRIRTIPGEGFELHVLKMTSQAWRTAGEVDRSIWWHWLTIIVPTAVKSDIALLFIGSGNNEEPEPDRPNPRLARIALATGTVVAEVRMVPNQPLSFPEDATGPLKEDGLIAFGWEKFLKGGDAGWLPRLPMTKSAVRAMDTVTAFTGSPEGGGWLISRFVVAGSSKRGWTTWTTAAVDERVVAIVPMVIDLLNFEASFQHHFRAYGFWAEAIESYVKRGIPDWFGTPEMKKLRGIVGPFEYRPRLTLPKLLLNAAGDQFFVPDSWQFYFDDLPGEKHLRYIPNTGHSLRKTDAVETLLAFYRAILTDSPRPDLSWSMEPDGAIRVWTPDTPVGAVLWQATNREARDFRLGTIGEAWTATPLDPVGPGEYIGRVAEPATGWTAFFVELTFPGDGPYPFKFTTGVRVVPDRLPFADP